MTIDKLYKYTFALKDSNHRFISWEHCYEAFESETVDDVHALHLGFYLASWGMYRGSSGLLQKNHLIHKGAVEILYKKKYRVLRCSQGNEVDLTSVPKIVNLCYELKNYYLSYGAESGYRVSPTDTLITKIILGTLGCLPAYDRFLTVGLRNEGFAHSAFKDSLIIKLIQYAEKNKTLIEKIQQELLHNNGYYPKMKILDMYFWQIGFDQIELVKK